MFWKIPHESISHTTHFEVQHKMAAPVIQM